MKVFRLSIACIFVACFDYEIETTTYTDDMLAYCIDEELYKAINYLREQVRVLSSACDQQSFD